MVPRARPVSHSIPSAGKVSIMSQIFSVPPMWKNGHKSALCPDLGVAQAFQPEGELIYRKSTSVRVLILGFHFLPQYFSPQIIVKSFLPIELV